MTTTTERMLPLYEAKMIHQFDHRWATFDGTEARDVREEEKQRADTQVLGRYWIDAEHVDKALKNRGDNPWLIGWRNIARSTDERTTIAAVLPRVAVGHSMPLVLGSKSLILAANLTTFISDYVARQKVGGTNFTFGYFEQLAILPPDRFGIDWTCAGESAMSWMMPRLLELHYTAEDLRPVAKSNGDNGNPFQWDSQRRKSLRCEIDAAFFHLYGIIREDVDYIMDTFPIVKRKDEAAFGEFKTKRLILEAYDAMQVAIETGIPFESTLNPPPGQGPRHPVKVAAS